MSEFLLSKEEDEFLSKKGGIFTKKSFTRIKSSWNDHLEKNEDFTEVEVEKSFRFQDRIDVFVENNSTIVFKNIFDEEAKIEINREDLVKEFDIALELVDTEKGKNIYKEQEEEKEKIKRRNLEENEKKKKFAEKLNAHLPISYCSLGKGDPDVTIKKAEGDRIHIVITTHATREVEIIGDEDFNSYIFMPRFSLPEGRKSMTYGEFYDYILSH